MITTPAKLVIEVWNVAVDFTAQLQTGETIISGFATTISSNGLVATFQALNGNQAIVELSGGTAGTRSIVQVGVNTSTGEVLAENVQIPVC